MENSQRENGDHLICLNVSLLTRSCYYFLCICQDAQQIVYAVYVITMAYMLSTCLLFYLNITCNFEFNLNSTFTSKIENNKNHRN